jgi:hypothetical protein
MRMTLMIAAATLVAGLSVVSADATATPETGAIRGNVVDLTCYGPCIVERQPHPFGGPGKVVVMDVATGERAATKRFQGSTFGIAIEPGTYRVWVIPYPAEDQPHECWRGSQRRVHIAPGEAQVVRLTVQNDCVL